MTIITKLRRQFWRQRVTVAMVISLSAAISVGLIVYSVFELPVFAPVATSVSVLLIAVAVYYRSGSFSLPPSEVIVRYLDRSYPMAEESAGLYLKQDLNRLQKLQLRRVDRKLMSSAEQIKLPRKRLFRSVLMSALLLAVSSLFAYLATQSVTEKHQAGIAAVQQPDETGTREAFSEPVIESVKIAVTPPGYTTLGSEVLEGGSVEAAALSNLTWTVEISGDVSEAALIFNDRDRVELQPDKGFYSASITAENRLIYRISASTADTTIYSNYYSINVINDRPPQFRVTSPAQMRTLFTESNRQTDMIVQVLDDYGVQEVYLNATLARGSGESVRFREQRMEFDRVSGLGTRSAEAAKTLHADSLGMTPGDELYLYVTAIDNHPDAQAGRSDTYMLVVEDTTRAQPLMAGNIVIDLMPEDFRSQRQIIVDTEELISQKNSISDEQFKLRSRRIGRDQEMLMLDFGQYMSMEEEASSDGSGMAEEGHDHDGHDHGGEAELDGEGQEVAQSSAASDIPEEFFHDHGSPEMNTLFAESPRVLLRRALSEMFRASQYLQTDRPDEALAYEYRALEFLQEAQQADRRYVRRAGLEGIPIPVEEERFTGEIDDFAAPESNYRTGRNVPPLVLLEQQIREGQVFSGDEFEAASETIREAGIPESDKLYILNRLSRLDTPDESEDIRQQVLTKLSEINATRPRNPSPLKVPVIRAAGENR